MSSEWFLEIDYICTRYLEKDEDSFNSIYASFISLDGLERGINDKARQRAIVIHSAWYAEESVIKKYGRLGRSFGKTQAY